ncbi:MAG: hypothetical protein HYU39_02990 [Thaumarchaeota archaeon]|nr:hypothetical protein [Nitrososphaerota archaeon]
MSIRLSSAEVSFLIHATEDELLLVDIVAKKLSISKDSFEIRRMTGHFGNPITQCVASIHGEVASRFAEGLFEAFDSSDRILLKKTLPEHIDEHGVVYLRIDKQKLLDGRIGFAERDPVRVRLKLASPWRRSAAQVISEIL